MINRKGFQAMTKAKPSVVLGAAILLALTGCSKDKGSSVVGPFGDGTWTLEKSAYPDSAVYVDPVGRFFNLGGNLVFLGRHRPEHEPSWTNRFLKWDAAKSVWTDLESTITYFWNISALASDSSLIVFGDSYDGHVETYSIRTRSWSTGTFQGYYSGPGIKTSPVVPYLYGGYFYDTQLSGMYDSARVRIMDLPGFIWSFQHTDLPWNMRGAFAYAFNGEFFFIGKVKDKGGPQLRIGKLDAATQTWKDILREDVPEEYIFDAVGAEDAICIAGRPAGHPKEETRARLFNLRTLEFTDFGELPVNTEHFQLLAFDRKILFIATPSRQGDSTEFRGMYSRVME
jgi:hypothetical protein